MKRSVMSLIFLCSGGLFAQVMPQRPADIEALEFRSESLNIVHDYRATHELASRSADYEQRLQNLGVSPASARLDARSGRWTTLLPSFPLIPGDGRGNQLKWSNPKKMGLNEIGNQTWDRFMEYLQVHEADLGISIAEIAQPGRVTIHRDGQLIQLFGQRVIDGIAVQGSYLTATISHGNLTLMTAVNWSDMDAILAPTSRLNHEDADLLTADFIGRQETTFWRAPELRIVPLSVGETYDIGQGLTYRLVYATSPNLGGSEDDHWEVLVDAYSGEVLAFQDTYHYFGTKEIKGGVFPITNNGVASQGGVQVAGYPMPFANLTHTSGDFTTDTGGNLAECLTGTITTTLEGPYLAMNDDCGPGVMSESTTGDLLDLGESGTDCDTPPGATSAANTSATRSGFYEIGKIQEMGRGHLPNNTWLRLPLPSQMNIAITCNATGGPGGLRFYRSGGGCANTGELAGVFDHEWGHGMDGADASPFISNPGEGIADIYASLRLNTSCIGRNFRLGNNCGGYGDPCVDCDGVRDIDWAQRASGLPHDVAWVSANCPTGPGPCSRSVHCSGAAYAEAVWDLWNRDLTAAPYNMNIHQAREIAAHLSFIGSGLVGTWYTCNTSGEAGCSADGGYLNYLATDDDDGDINNGTPHMAAIFAAFDRHGVACSTPAVVDSGCVGTPTTATTVTGTAFDKGASLEWTAVAAATSYRVFRTEGEFDCDFGKVLLTETDQLSFFDVGLQNGREYYYQVAAMGPGASCIGPLSTCTTVTPAAGPNLALLDASVAVTTLSGDGDPFVDNCENAQIVFDISNVGAAVITNPRITAVQSPSHPLTLVSTSLPYSLGASIAACDTATATLNVVPDGMAFNDTLVLEITFTGDELGGNTLVSTVEIGNTESDFAAMPTLIWDFEGGSDGWITTSGTFGQTSAFGGGDGSSAAMASSNGLHGQCDTVISPVVRFTSTTTLAVWTHLDVESFSSASWWDRANVTLVDHTASTANVVNPNGGRTYNASGTAVTGFCTNGEDGWADVQTTWAVSTFDAAALGSASVAGNVLQLEMQYGTDGAEVGTGFRFDQVTLTDVELQVADTQPDACVCATVTYDTWPTNDVSSFIGCVNLAPKAKYLVKAGTTTPQGAL